MYLDEKKEIDRMARRDKWAEEQEAERQRLRERDELVGELRGIRVALESLLAHIKHVTDDAGVNVNTGVGRTR